MIAIRKIESFCSSKWASVFMFSVLLSFAVMYVVFANSAVKTLSILEKTKTDIQDISISVSELESDKISKSSSINGSVAKSLGFVDNNNQIFIKANYSAKSLSLKTD